MNLCIKNNKPYTFIYNLYQKIRQAEIFKLWFNNNIFLYNVSITCDNPKEITDFLIKQSILNTFNNTKKESVNLNIFSLFVIWMYIQLSEHLIIYKYTPTTITNSFFLSEIPRGENC
jgi:hypothetical protein